MTCTCRDSDHLCPECFDEIMRDDVTAMTEIISEEMERRGEDA